MNYYNFEIAIDHNTFFIPITMDLLSIVHYTLNNSKTTRFNFYFYVSPFSEKLSAK